MLDTKGICKDEDVLFRTPTYVEYMKTPSYAEEQLEHALKKEAEKDRKSSLVESAVSAALTGFFK